MKHLILLTAVLATALGGCELANRSESRRTRERGRWEEPIATIDKHIGGQVISSLRKEHPRLLLTQGDFDRVRTRSSSQDPLTSEWLKKLHSRADGMLNDPPVKFAHPLIGASREAFVRIITLAGMFRLTGDARFAKRGREELLAVTQFPDWNTDDFLATGEMTATVAIGYDWLFDTLSSNDRTIIRAAIVSRGISPALNSFRHRDGWTTATNNWNFVCNGGVMLGALAVADDEPKLASQFIDESIRSMSVALPLFAPDGGWEEGPSYWNYATRYLVYAISALQTAGGTDVGLASAPGLSRTGMFRIYMQGPTGKLFNFGDCDEHTGACPQMFWMAKQFNQPAYAAFEAAESRDEPTMLDLLWYQPPALPQALSRLPRDARFREVDIVSLRSAWIDPNATYVGFKGGSNQAHHGHLDLGSFVLDALGQRWAIDLGADNYDLPGYGSGAQRWTYYRCSTEGHNTILIDGVNQNLEAVAPITAFSDDPQQPFAVVDLTRAYWHARRAFRGIMLLDANRVLVQDEVQSEGARQIEWNFHTRADVQIDHNSAGTIAILRQGGQTLQAEILSPAGVHFEIVRANPMPPQAQEKDVKNLTIRVDPDPRKDSPTTIAVIFIPMRANQSGSIRSAPITLKLQPLAEWASHETQ